MTSFIRQKTSTKDSLALFTLATLGLHLLLIVISFAIFLRVNSVANKPPPSLVQLEDGTAVKTKAIGNQERTDEVLQKFSKDILTTLFTWTGFLPGENNQPSRDKGVTLKINRGGRESKQTIPTPTWEASFALSEDFRKDFLVNLASLIPESVFKGETKLVFVPVHVGVPAKIKEGEWELFVIANILVFRETNKIGKVIPFRKKVYLRAVEIPDYLLLPKDSTSPAYAELIAKRRASGLEIYALQDLNKEEDSWKPQNLKTP